LITCLFSLVEEALTWYTALVAEKLVALHQMDAEEDGDAVVAVLHVGVRVLHQHLHRLPEHGVEELLRVVSLHHEELGEEEVFSARRVADLVSFKPDSDPAFRKRPDPT
jgi:hypothetical protein